jgi:hypothetical protein
MANWNTRGEQMKPSKTCRFGSRAIRRARLLGGEVGAPFERDFNRPPEE